MWRKLLVGCLFFFFQAEDGIRGLVRSRGLGDVYKRQTQGQITIDASQAGVILDGSGTAPDTGGLVIASDGNIVSGLQILYFPGDGISIRDGAKQNRIGGDRFQGSGLLGQGNPVSYTHLTLPTIYSV